MHSGMLLCHSSGKGHTGPEDMLAEANDADPYNNVPRPNLDPVMLERSEFLERMEWEPEH